VRSESVILLVAFASACAHRHRAVSQSVEESCFAGVPVSADPVTVLENPGYATGYSEERRNPLWGSYRLFPVDSPKPDERPSGFRTDARTTASVRSDCYTGSGFDRGHNAPNAAIDSRYGREAQRATFLMSNVTPQRCGLNREPWQALEALVANGYANELPSVFVISGPIFDATPSRIDCSVQIPVAFYKVIVDASQPRQPRVLAIVMGQDDTGRERRLSEFVTTVDCVEQLTGLDLLPDLPERVATQVESAPADAGWNLDTVLRPQSGCGGESSEQTIATAEATRERILAACR
jgi:endonuclease G, mitochondrial